MLTIALIVAVIYLFRTTQKNKQIALNKGIQERELMVFVICLWSYILPSFAIFLTREPNIIFTIVLIAIYIPGVVVSRRLSTKLSKGYDYERRAGREYDKAMWLGFAGIGLVVFSWASLNFQSWVYSKQAP